MIEMSILEQLATFQECGTLSAAAEHLLISQPSLSRSMKKLEEELGVTLFDRQKNKIFLNETGKIAAEHARHILESEAEMERHVRDFDRSLRSLSIGTCAPGPLFRLLPQAACLFEDTAVSSEMDTEENLIKGLKGNRYNLIVLSRPLDDKAYVSTKYISEQLYVNVPEGNLLASYDKISFAELDGLSFIMNANIGIWADIKEKYMPHAKYILLDDTESTDQLQRHSDLPGFSTDLSREAGHSVAPNRIHIKISDPAACVTFYLVCDRATKSKWKALFPD